MNSKKKKGLWKIKLKQLQSNFDKHNLNLLTFYNKTTTNIYFTSHMQTFYSIKFTMWKTTKVNMEEEDSFRTVEAFPLNQVQ